MPHFELHHQQTWCRNSWK